MKNNHDHVNVWTIAECLIARQYLIKKRPFYDKMQNKQKCLFSVLILHKIIYDSKKLHKKCFDICFLLIKNISRAF